MSLPPEGWIGRPLPRQAAPRLAAGHGRYVADAAAPGALHVAFLRSPFPQAAFRITDRAAALALPGVVAVLTEAELAPVCQPWQTASRSFPGMVSPSQRALAKDRAAYQGEPVAMVLARSRALAEDAVELIGVEWDESPAATALPLALAPGAPPVHPDLTSNLAWSGWIKGGDIEAAFAGAALVVEETLTFTRSTGVTLEPRGVLAAFDASTGALEVRISHQMPHQLQGHLADLLGLSLARVRVVCDDVGGGFGIKMHVYPDEIAACAAAVLLRRPVRFIADRAESLLADIHAREHIVHARMAVDAAGQILGFDVEDLQGLGAYSVFPRSSTVEAMSVLRSLGAPYRFAAYRGHVRCALQNKVPTGQYRSVGHPVGIAVAERLVDLAAAARGEDPLAFRRRNLVPAATMPWTSPIGGRMADLSHTACLAQLEALLDLPALRTEIAAMRAAGRCVGLGFASVVEFTATGPAGYGRAGVPVAAVDTVVLTLEPSGEVSARASVSEIGQGIQQGLIQVIADAVGLPPARVVLRSGDTAGTPHGGGAWASRGAAIGGEAAWGAGRRLRAELLRTAAALLQTLPEALDIRAGDVVDRASGSLGISLAELARTVLFNGYELPAGMQPQLTVAEHYRREADLSLPTNGFQASLVEIDLATGQVTPLRHWAVGDCGRLLNPLLVEEQMRGGVVQGLGEALLEACRYDTESGQFLSGSLADYLVPMAAGMPDIAIAHVETPYAGSVLGAKGAGEAGTAGAPAAVLNAVNDALAGLGARIAELPITPEVVRRALGRLA